MPRRCLDIKNGLFHLIQHAEVLVKDCFNLDESTEDLGTALTSEVRHLGLVAFLASCKVHLALTDLDGDTETFLIVIVYLHGAFRASYEIQLMLQCIPTYQHYSIKNISH